MSAMSRSKDANCIVPSVTWLKPKAAHSGSLSPTDVPFLLVTDVRLFILLSHLHSGLVARVEANITFQAIASHVRQ